MEATLQQDKQVFRQFQLAKSVVCIVLVIVVAFLIYTENFTAFDRTGAPEWSTVFFKSLKPTVRPPHRPY
ncbi:hypothetical protein [Persicitalea sp.]|uniref:hypothetical protein n=1 Tax=Persicitalea sp. TaxID=3100273 RepID=UPI00359313EE